MFVTLLLGGAFSVGQPGPQIQPTVNRPAWRMDGSSMPVMVETSLSPMTPLLPPDNTPKTMTTPPVQNGGSETNGSSKANLPPAWLTPKSDKNDLFTHRLYNAYLHEFYPDYMKDPEKNGSDEPAPRRALPAPFKSPPFPSAEYQGYPLIGVPPDSAVYPLMKAIYGGPYGEEIKDSRIKAYGWINASGNWSTSKNSNMPDSYWIVANRAEMDQFVFRVERQVDSVQTDHIDWGFRSTALYGTDYRYMTAGGWFSDQLLKHNALYGWDPTEQYFDLYVPGVAEGMIVRVGRWIACPDIETQFAPDNYMGSHSLLFTFDTYTQTGLMATFMLDKNWMVQGAITAGTDMAPWYKGATPTAMFGVRWVSSDNKDSVYTVLNNLNNAKFRYFEENGQLAGHDNFNYLVSTWQHKFCDEILTKTEGYFMWQRDAVLGGTPSLGPLKPFGGGGGIGAPIPGTSLTYGLVNYTMFGLSEKDFLTFRNEWWRDEKGERTGFPGTYTSNSIGVTHNFNSVLQIRPEIGYYRNWTERAFDLCTRQNMLMYGFDMTYRF